MHVAILEQEILKLKKQIRNLEQAFLILDRQIKIHPELVDRWKALKKEILK